ncbi:MAG: aminopeptidase P N-terminal domain-containing protein [Firmicutes bacterium]|nr:aminopeptidase P N-terminal domain-containing protein [Bacillota bacterium]
MEVKIDVVARREALIKKLKNQSLTLVYAGVPKVASADEDCPFVVNRNFYYLTGITQANSVLFIVKGNEGPKIYLFIDEFDELKEKWTGRRLTIDEAREASHIDDILLTKNLQTKVDETLREFGQFGEINTVYLDLEKELKIGMGFTTHELASQFQARFPKVEILDVYDFVIRQRMIKSSSEVAAIRQSIATTDLGLKAIQKLLKPGLFEYQLEAIFRFTLQDQANVEPSFDTIIASGKNATILHYPTPNDKIVDGALVLCDLGASSGEYGADITRDYPANGKFNPLLRPGVTLLDLQKRTVDLLTTACLENNLFKTAEEISKHYFHNVSHHLGLNTHDAAVREEPLAPGMVITVEPGLYFKEFGIGVRIEDDVLVTATGSENLSAAIIKEIDEVEKALKR